MLKKNGVLYLPGFDDAFKTRENTVIASETFVQLDHLPEDYNDNWTDCQVIQKADQLDKIKLNIEDKGFKVNDLYYLNGSTRRNIMYQTITIVNYSKIESE